MKERRSRKKDNITPQISDRLTNLRPTTLTILRAEWWALRTI